jgi:hypothetical protein
LSRTARKLGKAFILDGWKRRKIISSGGASCGFPLLVG